MSLKTAILGLPLALGGIVRLRLGVKDAIETLESVMTPKVVTDATTTIAITAADHFWNADLLPAKDPLVYCTNNSAVTATISQAESDKLPIGAKLKLIADTGAITFNVGAGLTKIDSGAAVASGVVEAQKLTATVWHVAHIGVAA